MTDAPIGAPPTEKAFESDARPARLSALSAQRRRAAWIFLLPMLLVLALVAAWPLLQTIRFSLTDAKLSDLAGAKFIGFGNYYEWVDYGGGEGEAFGILVDPVWWQAVWNTVRYTLISVSIETVLGLVFALVLNANFPGRALVRAAVLIPWAIPTIVSAKLWAWLFNDQFGMIKDMLMSVGLIDQKIAWTANVETAMYAVLIVDIWKTTPFMALLCLAGLQMIPRDMYDAARIDGIHPVKVFFRVTLPLVKPALMVAVIFRLLDALRIFDLIYVLTPNSPATKTMSVISRENLIDFDKFAYGSAQSTLLFLIIALSVILYIWLGRVDLGGQKQ